MAILGAHMSIAGGHHRAVFAAQAAGCDCVQIFTKNNNQWRANELTDGRAAQFEEALGATGVSHPLAHASYLINLATPDAGLWRKSIDALVVELQRAERLGLLGVVLHPGAYTTSSEQAGLARIAAALDETHRQAPGIAVRVLLENTAGQGTNLGFRFEQLAAIIDAVAEPDRLAICFDTCHAFAAGYDMTSEKAYKATMRELNRTVGVALVAAFHLNDSQRPLGGRVDRHAHIGRGEMGTEPFRLLLADRRFRKRPMYLETPKGTENGEDFDRLNLSVLRGLAR